MPLVDTTYDLCGAHVLSHLDWCPRHPDNVRRSLSNRSSPKLVGPNFFEEVTPDMFKNHSPELDEIINRPADAEISDFCPVCKRHYKIGHESSCPLYPSKPDLNEMERYSEHYLPENATDDALEDLVLRGTIKLEGHAFKIANGGYYYYALFQAPLTALSSGYRKTLSAAIRALYIQVKEKVG